MRSETALSMLAAVMAGVGKKHKLELPKWVKWNPMFTQKELEELRALPKHEKTEKVRELRKQYHMKEFGW